MPLLEVKAELGRGMNWVPWRPFQNDWNRRYIPSRGLLYSFLVHELAFFACFTYSLISLPKSQLRTPDQEIHSAELVYLPSVGGGADSGHEGAKGREGEGKSDDKGVKKLQQAAERRREVLVAQTGAAEMENDRSAAAREASSRTPSSSR